MKHYKNEWQTNDDDDSRKNIATQMASTTKNWVSMADAANNADKDQQQ